MDNAAIIRNFQKMNETLKHISVSRSIWERKKPMEEILKEILERLDRIEAKLGGSKSKYPAPIMKLSELKSIGFPESWLMKVYRKGRNKIAWKSSNAPNAPILFDTALLEKERKADCVGGY